MRPHLSGNARAAGVDTSVHRACIHHAAFPVLCPSLGDDHHASFRSYPIIGPLIASFQGPHRADCSAVTASAWAPCRWAVEAEWRRWARQHSPSTPYNTNCGSLEHAGRTFSRTGYIDVAILKPLAPLQSLMQAAMKPPSPQLTPEQQPLKPTTPLHPNNTRKTPISHPQRRRRFQLAHLTGPQRRRRFQTSRPPGQQGLATPPTGTHSGRALRRPEHQRGYKHPQRAGEATHNEAARPHRGRADQQVPEAHRRITTMSGFPRPLSWRTLEIPSVAATSFAVPSMRGSS